QACPHFEAKTIFARGFLSICSQRLLDGQGRVGGSSSMVLASDRAAKHGHDTVTEHLGRRSAKSLQRRDNYVQATAHERLGGFRVGPLSSGDLDKDNGQQFSLAAACGVGSTARIWRRCRRTLILALGENYAHRLGGLEPLLDVGFTSFQDNLIEPDELRRRA